MIGPIELPALVVRSKNEVIYSCAIQFLHRDNVAEAIAGQLEAVSDVARTIREDRDDDD